MISNIIEMPSPLTTDSKELIRGAIAQASDAISYLAQIERQLWTLLTHSSMERYTAKGYLLALTLCGSMSESATEKIDKIKEYLESAAGILEQK